MPEDAPGNPGAVEGRAGSPPMRRTSRYGGCRPSCTAGREKIPPAGSVTCSTSSTTLTFLAEAWMRVRQSGVADAGDRQGTVGHVETRAGGVSGFLAEIRDPLKTGSSGRRRGPAGDDTEGERQNAQLGIPTLADRVVQASSSWSWSPSSRRTSSRARTGSGHAAARRTR